ncbi:hypothetical protein M441DRAFT_352271 [Trichoderma asperellum CBS 433.97]|uniref:Secreted protein n=1 Tax=Trichoderma asperellum (strain ATCC 204424 / CBS 433.97 / NBRC 101777) TaxID=1042311 RepID=A0A2T3ZIM2_TRIA4|nr:hypothetical protein M441DRAFT_352271 [Trichoderma asperellum CBS 433.97]PTB44613.1 hypothetical protein M441DRAFT_352271 [Trichoderma asperellum CBS 433.97]
MGPQARGVVSFLLVPVWWSLDGQSPDVCISSCEGDMIQACGRRDAGASLADRSFARRLSTRGWGGKRQPCIADDISQPWKRDASRF